jgi:hypothetical protein
MRKFSMFFASVLVSLSVGMATLVLAADSDAKQYVGTWKGTWEGGGASGRFDLTLTQGADGKLSGGVSVGSDTGDYESKFSSVAITGNKLTAKYDYTPDAQAEIALTATLEAANAKGTWSMLPKGQATELASGTWTVAKK